MAITLDTITLPQGLRWADEFAWSPLAQATSYSLTGALLDAGEEMTITLHDARTFTVLPAGAEPLAVSPLPRVLGSGFANPGNDAWYVLESLKLIEV